jgi:SAM-dependent methyltransferase
VVGASSGAGGWEDWEWDPSLFEGSAPYYEAGRLPYAPGIGPALRDALDLDGTGRLLDLGCGPGTVTLMLAPYFAEAIGLDPDAGMIDEARRIAKRDHVTNARFVQRRAEDLPGDIAPVRVATLAASFHWMNRPTVAVALRGMLEPGGAAVQVDAPGYRCDDLDAANQGGELPYPPPPEEAMEQLRLRYLGPDRRAGQGIRNTSPSGEDDVFGAAGFEPAQRIVVPDGRVIERTTDQVVAGRFSSSSTAPHLLGDRKDDFEADLRAVLSDASPTGTFSVRLPDNVLSIWKAKRAR